MRFFTPFIALCMAASAWAAPETLPYQGRLLDASGEPINGTHDLTFRLYESEEGPPTWTEAHADVPVQDG